MSEGATFCTAVNCMDGRVQIPVIYFLRKRFGVAHVDVVTEPGPNRILAEQESQSLVGAIRRRVDISVERHGSKGIAVVAHEDCAGNPAEKSKQLEHLRKAVAFLASVYPSLEVIALWADLQGHVEEVRF